MGLDGDGDLPLCTTDLLFVPRAHRILRSSLVPPGWNTVIDSEGPYLLGFDSRSDQDYERTLPSPIGHRDLGRTEREETEGFEVGRQDGRLRRTGPSLFSTTDTM